MGPRWIEKERVALEEVKRRLRDEISSRPQYPDVVGDRRLIRFLRGKQNNVEDTVKMFSEFLKWRDENNVDSIRHQILYEGVDTPFKFPNGKKIIDLAPQIIISAKAKDYKGQPLVLEQYCFSPSEMLNRVTIQDYLLFLVYALEYRALVMEQMSHEEEMKYLEMHPNPDDREAGYGVVLLNFCIRDLNGVGVAHLTGKGKQIIEAAIKIGLPNYPEYLGKCHMVNVPWLFTSMWFFIKGLLDDFILAKINLTGGKFLDILLKDVPIESIPKALGGKFELYNESYAFDVSETGPFHATGKASTDIQQSERKVSSSGVNSDKDGEDGSNLDSGGVDNAHHNDAYYSDTKARPYELQTALSTKSFVSTDSELSHPSSDENATRLVTSSSTTSLTSHHQSAHGLDTLHETQSNTSHNTDSHSHTASKTMITTTNETKNTSGSTHNTYSTGTSFVLHSINSTTLPVCPKTLAPHSTQTTHITPTPLKQKKQKHPHTSAVSSLSDLQQDNEVRTLQPNGHTVRTNMHGSNTSSNTTHKHAYNKHSYRSALSTASSSVSTFQVMQHHASSFSDADSNSNKSEVDNKTTVIVPPKASILDYVTSPKYVVGALVVLLISVVNPVFVFRYLFVPFLCAFIFVYVL